jgi:hypothetical protein
MGAKMRGVGQCSKSARNGTNGCAKWDTGRGEDARKEEGLGLSDFRLEQ